MNSTCNNENGTIGNRDDSIDLLTPNNIYTPSKADNTKTTRFDTPDKFKSKKKAKTKSRSKNPKADK